MAIRFAGRLISATPRRRVIYYRWACYPPRMGMVSVRRLLACGWRKVREHPRFIGSWLLVKR